MKGNAFLLKFLKILFTVLFLFLFGFIILKIYNSNIWIYKSYVLFMVLILVLYFVFRLLNVIVKVKKQIVAKIIDIKEFDNIIEITYQYMDENYIYKVDYSEYYENRVFKYTLYKWYTLIVENNKVIQLLDPALEPSVNNGNIEKKYYKTLKHNIHVYMFYLYEFLFLVNVILFPLVVVLTNYKINAVLFIIIELVNIVLFFVNSKILKKD